MKLESDRLAGALAAPVLAALLLAGCTGGAAPAPGRSDELFGGPRARETLGPAATPEQGRRLYDQICRACHDPAGRGQTALARDLDPQPHDLTLCNFKYRSTPSGTLPTEDDLLRTLHVGLPGTAMPAFAELLSAPEQRALVLQIKARCDQLDDEPREARLQVPPAAPYTAASLIRGRAVYEREGCPACHGPRGAGDGPAAPALKDAQGRSIRPRDYTRGMFRSGFDRSDIYRAFSTGLDGTPMPALPGAVSARDRWDLTHYIVSRSQQRSRLWRLMTQEPTWYAPASNWSIRRRSDEGRGAP